MRLLSFFDDLPVAQWFNRSAPAVKTGDIVPEQLDAATALALLQDDPLLIRRPLMEVGERAQVGFDAGAGAMPGSAWATRRPPATRGLPRIRRSSAALPRHPLALLTHD